MLGTHAKKTHSLTALTLAAIYCIAAQNAHGDTGWTNWQSLGRMISNPVVGEDPFRISSSSFVSGKPMVVTVDRTGKWLTVMEERAGFWGSWYFLNHPRGLFPHVAMSSNGSSQPILFYRLSDGEVWFNEVIRQGTGATGLTRWTAHQSLGKPPDAFPNLVFGMKLSGGRVAVCFTDSPTSTIRCRFRQGDGRWLDTWSRSPRAPGAIGLSLTGRLDADHRIHFFAASADTLFELTEGSPSPLDATWRTISRLPTGLRLASPMAAANVDGRLEVFARGSDNTLWHIYQQPGTSTWSSWESMGRPPGVEMPFGFANDAVAENDDGRLEVFVVAGDSDVWHSYQKQPNCCWSGWESLGHPRSEWKLLTDLRVVRRQGQKLELFALDQQGTLWTIYQQ